MEYGQITFTTRDFEITIGGIAIGDIYKGANTATSDLQYRVGGDPIGSEECKRNWTKVFEVGRGSMRLKKDLFDRKKVF